MLSISLNNSSLGLGRDSRMWIILEIISVFINTYYCIRFEVLLFASCKFYLLTKYLLLLFTLAALGLLELSEVTLTTPAVLVDSSGYLGLSYSM